MKLRPFELALVIFFGILGIAALIILNVYDGTPSSPDDEGYVGPVQIWGTLPSTAVNPILTELREENELLNGVRYRSIDAADFNQVLLEALADQAGPDLILTSHENLAEQRKRIRAIPYSSLPLVDFRGQYVDGAQLYALSDGIYGTPLMVDPLMMYWNRDILTNNGFLSPPRTWEELVNVQLPALIERGFDRSINRGVVALGVYNNTENAYGVLSTLLIQSGSALVSEVQQGDSVQYQVNLNLHRTAQSNPFDNTLSFYTRFSQPANSLYSWNRSFSSDQSEFISSDLVFYFGYGSEGRELERLNPNLNFDIAEIPQGEGASLRRTYGQFYAISPLRTADNMPGAFSVMSLFSSDRVVQSLTENTGMVPVKRTLVTAGSSDTYGRLSYRSAPITYGWLNPAKTEVDVIFNDMISDISENRSTISAAARTAEEKLSNTYD